ncbi:MAG: SGNH/GDSL hydrolase family protein [Bacteroidota bacterium]
MNTLIGIVLLKCLLAPFQCDFDIKNRGIGGNSTSDLIARVETDVISENPDIVILMIGTNDMVNSHKMISYERFSSNLDRLICLIKTNSIDIVLVSPPPVDTIYLFERHDKEKFLDPPNKKLATISNILKNKSAENDLSYIDINNYFKRLGVPDHDTDTLINNVVNSGLRDGVHLTEHGNKIVAQQIFASLINTGKIKKGGKIICFGDSLTYGAHVDGEGTTTRDTYPAYLRELICNYIQK